MNDKRSLRVYVITHNDGRVTGILLRTWDWIFDKAPPSAFGASTDDVLAQIEAQLHAMSATRSDDIDRYLWDEAFDVHEVSVVVYPQTTVKKQPVIGKRQIPLRLTYLASQIPSGGYRLLVPRFGWRFTVESLSIAADVLRHAVSSALVGESANSLYDFRQEGREHVIAWSPRIRSSKEAFSHAEDEGHMRAVRAVADDLVELAAKQKLPLSFGDPIDLEIEAPWLRRSILPSILLVGEPGTGKTTWIHRLARRMAALRQQKNPNAVRIWSTRVDRILAGMKYLGMWQERCLALVQELSYEGDLLEVGPLLSLFKEQADGSTIADLFAPAVRSGALLLIAEATNAELLHVERRAASFLAAFQIVRLSEMDPRHVPALLMEYEERKSPPMELHPAAKKRLVQHLLMFRRDIAFPGKAIRFYDWLSQESSPREAGAPRRMLYPRDVSDAYARYSGIPIELVADEVPGGSSDISVRLQKRVIGQPLACETAARVLARFKAGLDDPDRPSGTLLFLGPTGVGKTELAKALTEAMFGDEAKMVRLDMSEYAHPGASRRLLAVGTSVVSLATRVRQDPLSLVLFDEIEKADAEVLDVLLGILGEGRLTDEEGRLVDFRMTVIVLTSNLGVAETRAVGFGANGGERGVSLARAREHFRPELWNRIDHVVPFRSLAKDDVLRIVDLEIAKAAQRTGFVKRRLRLVVRPDAKALLADLGVHPTWGARPLKRVIEERVITPIAARLASDATVSGRDVIVQVSAGDIQVVM